MKHLLLSGLLMAATVSASAQAKLEDIVKQGTRLVYEVNSNNEKYDFIVTVLDKKGSSFVWEMTAPVNRKGTITQTKKALDNGCIMWNSFDNGAKKLDDSTLSVWISQKVFNALKKSGSMVRIGMYGPGERQLTMSGLSEWNFEILVDGKTTSIGEKIVKPYAIQQGFAGPDLTISDFFTYYNNQSLPIILRMHDKFDLALKEIKTKVDKPSVPKPVKKAK